MRTITLRNRLLAAIATSTLAAACGGAVEGDEGAGGASGDGGSAGSSGSAGSAGNSGSSGSGGTSGSGGASTGGSGGVGAGGSTGGTGGFGAGGSTGGSGGFTGGAGGTAGTAGSAGSGGTAGSGGNGGFGAGGGTNWGGGLTTYGTVDCYSCGQTTWTSCWAPKDVPAYENAQPGPDGCYGPYDVQGWQYEPCKNEGGGEVWYNSVEFRNGQCCYETSPACFVGRPLQVEGHARTAPAAERGDWQQRTLDPVRLDEVTRDALRDAWLGDALYEHASVAAFNQLTLELMAFAAPPELLAGSQKAAADEVRHALSCFALAGRFSDAPLGPGALPLDGMKPAETLSALAVSSFEEGCVGETLAALIAGEQSRVASDAATREALSEISDEETEHAELSWRIVRWAIEVGGADVRRAVELAWQRKLDEEAARLVPEHPEHVDLAAWHAHGRLTEAEAAEVRRRGLREVVGPCVEALLGVTRAHADQPVARA